MTLELDKIYCMDCIKGMESLNRSSIHLIVTSPPYNIGKDYKIYEDKLDYWEYVKWLKGIWERCYRVLVGGGILCINIGDIYISKTSRIWAKRTEIREILPSYAHMITSCMDMKFSFQEHFIWNKIGSSEDNKKIFGSYPYPVSVYATGGMEHILIFKKGKYRNIKGKRTNDNKISLKDWMTFTNPIRSFGGDRLESHCASFPEELPRRLIRMYSFVGDTVLDPFIGIGTTAVACKRLRRHFIGFEINPEYIEVANKRLVMPRSLLEIFANEESNKTRGLVDIL